jgi:transcriptional regulator with XRE-family HTH domain
MTPINSGISDEKTKEQNGDKLKRIANLAEMKTKSKDVDQLVGKKIKLFRQLRRCSQSDISDQLGITFQQFQKYESGKNRIPISRLMKLAEIFETNISVFFENTINVMFEDVGQKKANRLNEEVYPLEFGAPSIRTGGEDEEVLNLIKSFKSIKDEGVRNHISMLVKSLAVGKSN